MIDLAWISAAELARLYARKVLSPVEVVEASLKRAERLQPRLNFLVGVDAEGALITARASEARWKKGQPLSPLDGVPTSIKDNVDLAGWPTRNGSYSTDE